MDLAIKKQIISELDSLPDKKGYSLLDYLHFLVLLESECDWTLTQSF